MRSAVIKGLDKMGKRLTTQDFIAKPTGTFLRDWRENLKREVLDRVPRNTGGLAEVIESIQDSARFPLFARVFAEDPKARWLEYGTGELSEDPKSPKMAYFPPPERLRDWAGDGDPYALAYSIWRAGGTPPTHFFSDAERAADAAFSAQVARFGRNIGKEAERNV